LIVVSSGEPAGIGPDLVLAHGSRAFAARLAVLGDPTLLATRARALGSSVRLQECASPAAVGPHQPGHLQVLHVPLRAPVRAGEPHVVISWPIEIDGRKRHSGSALFTADGELLASARALWIELKPN